MAQALSVEVEYTDSKSCVVHLVGEVDLASAPLLREALLEVIHAGCLNISVDAARLVFIDSTGIGVLIGTHKRIDMSAGNFTVINAQPRVERTLLITGVAGMLGTGPDA